MEDLSCNIIVIPEKRKQQVLCSNDVGFIQFGFEVCNFQYLLGLFRKGYVANCESSTGSPDCIFDGLL